MSLENVADALDAFIFAQNEANAKAAEFAKAVADRYKVDLEKLTPQDVIDEAEGLQNGTFYLMGVAAVMNKATDVIKAVMIDPEAAKDFPKDAVNNVFDGTCQLLENLEDAITNHATSLDEDQGEKDF